MLVRKGADMGFQDKHLFKLSWQKYSDKNIYTDYQYKAITYWLMHNIKKKNIAEIY